MKSFLLALTLIFFFDKSTSETSKVFLADETDIYLKASFNREVEIESLLNNPSNQQFSIDFDAEFHEDFDKLEQYEKLKVSNVDDWELQLFDRRNAAFRFLKSHPDYAKLSPDFLELVQNNINYNYWHLLLAYSINRSNDNTGLKEVTSLPRIMTETINPEKIDDPKRLLSKSYREFLPYFIVYFNSEDKNFKKYADPVKSISDKSEFAAKYLKGDVLDYASAKLIEQNYKLLSTTSFTFWTSQIYCQNLQKYLSDTFYEELVAAEKDIEIATAKDVKSRSNLPVLMDLSDKSFTFEKYKGKVIYVDFWASWCGPCRQEFPYSRKMHESLDAKEKKEIVFLYISIDEDIGKWREAVQKLGLQEFGENGHSYEVARQYKVSSIPRYMIIDKKGNIFDDTASRPSNPETLQTILGLL